MANTASDLGLKDCDYPQISRFVGPVFAQTPDGRLYPYLRRQAGERPADSRLARLYEAAVVAFTVIAPREPERPLGEVLTASLDPALRLAPRQRWYLNDFLLACVGQTAQLAAWDDDHATAGRLLNAAAVLQAELVYGTTWLLADAATRPAIPFARVLALADWNGALLAWMGGLHPYHPAAPGVLAATERLDAIDGLLAAPITQAAAAAAGAAALEKIRAWKSQTRRP